MKKGSSILVTGFFLVFSSAFSPAMAQGRYKNYIGNSPDSMLPFKPLYFVVGTLNEYIGRFYSISRQGQVDMYYTNQTRLREYVDSLIEKEFADTILVQRNRTYSDNFSKKINAFYTDNSILFDTLFTKPEDIYSYIAGAYLRYGDKISDSIYKVQLVNSPNNVVFHSLLKKINCDKIYYHCLRNIPVSHIFYFEPPPQLKLHLDKLSTIKEIINSEFYSAFSVEIAERSKEFQKKENARIRELMK